MTDHYHGWNELLAGRKHPIHEGSPLCGFWRQRERKGGPWQRVAIWMDGDGSQFATVDASFAEPADIWLWCAKHPITEADYRHHEKHGTWPGDAAPMGHNRHEDPYEALCQDIDATVVDALAWLGKTPVEDQMTADIAGNKVGLIRDLSGKASSAHRTEKEPHLLSCRAVDGKYNPMIKRLTESAEALKRAVARWAARERARIDDERRKVEAERSRIEAENRARAEISKSVEDSGRSAVDIPELSIAALPPLPNVKVQAGGGVGRKLGFKTDRRAIVTDYAAAFAIFKDHPDVVQLVEKLAQQSFRATGACPPGCEIRDEVRAI